MNSLVACTFLPHGGSYVFYLLFPIAPLIALVLVQTRSFGVLI